MVKAITVPPAPAKPDVQLTLSWDDAEALREIVGSIGGPGSGEFGTLYFLGDSGRMESLAGGVAAARQTVSRIYDALTALPGMKK